MTFAVQPSFRYLGVMWHDVGVGSFFLVVEADSRLCTLHAAVVWLSSNGSILAAFARPSSVLHHRLCQLFS